jgi:hypothetical protein
MEAESARRKNDDPQIAKRRLRIDNPCIQAFSSSPSPDRPLYRREIWPRPSLICICLFPTQVGVLGTQGTAILAGCRVSETMHPRMRWQGRVLVARRSRDIVSVSRAFSRVHHGV